MSFSSQVKEVSRLIAQGDYNGALRVADQMSGFMGNKYKEMLYKQLGTKAMEQTANETYEKSQKITEDYANAAQNNEDLKALREAAKGAGVYDPDNMDALVDKFKNPYLSELQDKATRDIESKQAGRGSLFSSYTGDMISDTASDLAQADYEKALEAARYDISARQADQAAKLGAMGTMAGISTGIDTTAAGLRTQNINNLGNNKIQADATRASQAYAAEQNSNQAAGDLLKTAGTVATFFL